MTLTGLPCYWRRSVFSVSRNWIFCIMWMNVMLRLTEGVVSRSFEPRVSPWVAATSRTWEHGGGDGVQENRQTVRLLNTMCGVFVSYCLRACVHCLVQSWCVNNTRHPEQCAYEDLWLEWSALRVGERPPGLVSFCL